MIDWPLNIGNRPPHGPPANIPITFELAVLLGGGSSFFGFFALAKLPQPYHPVFESEDFPRAVDRRASSCRSSCRRGTDVDRALADVRTAGALSGRDRRGVRAMTRASRRLLVWRPRSSRSPHRRCIDENILDPMADSQPKANRYRESKFFADGLTMQAPPEGTVPRERITLNARR